jgi:two-component system copper resistance phosphate regulon response regulator CusR
LHDTTLSISDLTIDTRAHQVRRGATTIPLTSKEYALLEYLALHSGEVVGRAEIAEHVWEETYDPFSNLIEVYIQRLRKKLDSGHSVRLLQTRRGEGYVLTAEPEKYV